MQLVTGLGHACDRTLADEAACRAADMPGKAPALVRDLVVRPARRAQAGPARTVAVMLSGLDRAADVLDAGQRRDSIKARCKVAEASARLETAWAEAERRGSGLGLR